MEYIDLGTCCDDCTVAIANDDYTGMDDGRAKEVADAIEAINQPLVIGDQTDEFSWSRCDICGSGGGSRHAVGYLTEKGQE